MLFVPKPYLYMLSQSRTLYLNSLQIAVRSLTTSLGRASAANVYSPINNQDALVDSLVRQGLVRSPRIESVLRALDRREFTSTHMGIPAHVSYSDSQVPIGQGQSVSAPSLHATCLELLEGHVRPGAAVLDVGAGTGYLTACLSLLVGREGRVVALERLERVVEHAGFALAKSLMAQVGDLRHTAGSTPLTRSATSLHTLRLHNVVLLHGNALDDTALAAAATSVAAGGGDGLFDAVHVGAAARQVPPGLLALLRPGGRMVLPLGPPAGMQSLTVVDKAADGTVSNSKLSDVKLSPLAPPNAERPL